MKISDRALGYITILVLLSTIVGIAFSMWEAHQGATQTILVDFEELGTLQPEDNVVVRGYTVGTIGEVKWLGDRARVQVNLTEPIKIREGTQFNNVNYAIMGQRQLEIIPSKTGKILPEDYIHTGYFEPGIAEVLRYIEDVNEQLEVIRGIVIMIAEGDSTHKSAAEIFENTMRTIEGILKNSDKMISKLQPALNKIFTKANQASKDLIKIADQADQTVKVATNTVNDKMAQADKALKAISDGAARTNEIISSIERDPLSSKLLNSRETVDKVNELIEKMNKLVRAIDARGIELYDENGKPVQLITWQGINLAGKTAREKARERAAADSTKK